jgi:hypothetical protein
MVIDDNEMMDAPCSFFGWSYYFFSDVHIASMRRTTILRLSRVALCVFVDHLVIARPLVESRNSYFSIPYGEHKCIMNGIYQEEKKQLIRDNSILKSVQGFI